VRPVADAAVARTDRERETAALFADLHRHATDTYALEYMLPALRVHLAQLGLEPDTALRGTSVLDGGCGGFAGGVACALALGAARATGIDLSEGNIRAARERFRDRPEATFRNENLLSLTLDGGQFDFVYSVGVLMITEDPEQAFRELLRMVKPGGRIYIGVYGRGGLFNEIAVPAMKLAGKIVPRPVTARVLRFVPQLLRPSTSLMDFMYCPIEIHYRISEVEGWFRRAGLEPAFLRHPYQPDGWKTRLLYGNGTMIFFSAVKP
jgi:2-polyprenyl-3-methyl-5-hydroxy-6-metoxy-1,4-benzoquinol methylase